MTITIKDLFLGFLKIGMMGFGGVALVARHVIVEDRRWMDDRDYAALLGFGQILPGANVTNMAIILGRRHAGVPGVIAAVGGLLFAPLVMLLILATAYAQAAAVPAVAHAVAAMASVAGGLLIGTAVKSARKAKLDKMGMGLAVIGFGAVDLLQLPMPLVLLALLPVSIMAVWRQSKPQ